VTANRVISQHLRDITKISHYYALRHLLFIISMVTPIVGPLTLQFVNIKLFCC